MLKPMLASDLVVEKLKFPLIVQPKIDGVRGTIQDCELRGRSMKKHANKVNTILFSHSIFNNLDGELFDATAGIMHPDLCRITSSAMSTFDGAPYIKMCVFDYLANPDQPYSERLKQLHSVVNERAAKRPDILNYIQIVDSYLCSSLDEFQALEQRFLDEGYEGIIVRNPIKPYKQGRSTVREQGLLRGKQFVKEKAIVVEIREGVVNNNEAQTNERGLTFRSSHKANLEPSGKVGTLVCKAVTSFKVSDTLTIEKGQTFDVAPGKMPHDERTRYFVDQSLIVGKTIQFKFFPKGCKDKPRFPTFDCICGDTEL